MKTLAIDTSSKAATVAVIEDKKLLGVYTLNLSTPHSQISMVLIEELLNRLNLTAKDIDLFAAAQGPGSFTGLRVGIATIKGLADGAEKPSVGVSTLQAMAHKFSLCDSYVCPILDARRNQVYYALYKNGEEILSPDMCDINILLSKLSCFDKKIIFTGDCIDKHKALISETLKDNSIFPPEIYDVSDAAAVAYLAEKLYLNKQNKPIAPEYLVKAYVEQQEGKE